MINRERKKDRLTDRETERKSDNIEAHTGGGEVGGGRGRLNIGPPLGKFQKAC